VAFTLFSVSAAHHVSLGGSNQGGWDGPEM